MPRKANWVPWNRTPGKPRGGKQRGGTPLFITPPPELEALERQITKINKMSWRNFTMPRTTPGLHGVTEDMIIRAIPTDGTTLDRILTRFGTDQVPPNQKAWNEFQEMVSKVACRENRLWKRLPKPSTAAARSSVPPAPPNSPVFAPEKTQSVVDLTQISPSSSTVTTPMAAENQPRSPNNIATSEIPDDFFNDTSLDLFDDLFGERTLVESNNTGVEPPVDSTVIPTTERQDIPIPTVEKQAKAVADTERNDPANIVLDAKFSQQASIMNHYQAQTFGSNDSNNAQHAFQPQHTSFSHTHAPNMYTQPNSRQIFDLARYPQQGPKRPSSVMPDNMHRPNKKSRLEELLAEKARLQALYEQKKARNEALLKEKEEREARKCEKLQVECERLMQGCAEFDKLAEQYAEDACGELDQLNSQADADAADLMGDDFTADEHDFHI